MLQNHKQLAELAQLLLEEVILHTLAEAHFDGKQTLSNKELTERSGIDCIPEDYGIVRIIARRLEEKGLVLNERGLPYNVSRSTPDRWMKTK